MDGIFLRSVQFIILAAKWLRIPSAKRERRERLRDKEIGEKEDPNIFGERGEIVEIGFAPLFPDGCYVTSGKKGTDTFYAKGSRGGTT